MSTIGCGPGLVAYREAVAKFLTALPDENISPPEFPETICRLCSLEVYGRLLHLLQHATNDVSQIVYETNEARAELLDAQEAREKKPTIN